MSKLGCHGCAFEWGNACDEHKVHMPSDASACQDCRRNPNRKVLATRDHYITPEQFMREAVGESHEQV